ncbi:histidine kinase [Blautia pseudococcoides]|uniref:sensor histidine kinase n=1 Tax=Blautia pseudococcoides TaxID=1796616 RepID=UPI00148B1D3E|nr:sensor histidine kinase [Blautia pseudococcoides]QJU15897.1 histidine kinase [Blautia pseudococcoides]
MKKWMEKISRWKFDKKMQLLVTVSIIATTLIVLAVSTISSVTSMKQQSIELLQAQNSTTAENFKSSLDNYKTLAIATVMDTSIQQYLKAANYSKESGGLKNSAYNILSSISNMHSDMNFIAIVGKSPDDYIYKGQIAISAAQFTQVYSHDSQQCKTVQDSSIKMCFNNAYYNGSRYTLNIYFPIYDTNRVLGELGLLCMNFTDPSLQQILEYDSSKRLESMVVDTEGMLISSRNKEKIGTNVDFIPKMKEKSGTFSMDGRLYIYQKVSNWRFYVVSSVPMMELYKSSIRTIFFMAFILLFLLTVSLLVVKRIISKVYRPLDKVVRKIDDVASGSLKTRINVEHMGEDFTKLAVGFNSMMEEILVLMEQVKMEQHQIEQIRFNALQSQIQPHFLYNTLECIHWQAMVDGNEEISTLVKALAKYYRICLSGGHDVIPLKMELEHVRNYLIIQNMRYDDIIGSEFDVEEAASDVMIPKLTLQPLVENSIYHGIKVKEGKTGSLFLKVRKRSSDVLITLADTGTGMSQQQIDEMNQHLSEYDDSFGYGVRNVNKRIELLYGEEYGLYYLRNESGGVTVEIRLPYVTQVEDGIIRGEMIHV